MIGSRFLSWWQLAAFMMVSAICFAQAAKPLKNADIEQMVAAGLNDDTIAMAIHSRACEFDTSVDALIGLKKTGVSQRIMELMLVSSQPAPAKVPTAPAATPPPTREVPPAVKEADSPPPPEEAADAGRRKSYVRAHRGAVWALAVSPDGKLIVSGGKDKKIKIWSWPEGRLLKTLEGHTGGVGSLAISADGAFLYSSSMDKTVRVWSLPEGALLKTMGPFDSRILSLSLSPDGRMLAGGSMGKTLRVWSLPDGAVIKTIDENNDVENVAFSPDGNLLAYNTVRSLLQQIKGRNQIKVLDTKTWSVRKTLQHTGSAWTKTNENVFSLRFVTATTLLAGEANGATWLWSVETGTTIGGAGAEMFHTEDIPVWAVAAAPNGRTLASCSQEGVIVFNGAGQREVVIQNPNVVLTLAFADRDTLVFGDGEGFIEFRPVSVHGAKGTLEDPQYAKK